MADYDYNSFKAMELSSDFEGVLLLKDDFPYSYDVNRSPKQGTMELSENTIAGCKLIQKLDVYSCIITDIRILFAVNDNYYTLQLLLKTKYLNRGTRILATSNNQNAELDFTNQNDAYYLDSEPNAQDKEIKYAGNIKFYAYVTYYTKNFWGVKSEEKRVLIKLDHCNKTEYEAHSTASLVYNHPITSYGIEIQSLSIANAKNTFYKNEAFSVGNLEVNATYHFPASGYAWTETITNYSIQPILGTELTDSGTATISFKNLTATYNYIVYKVKSYNTPITKSYYKKGEALVGVSNVTITYDDDTTETVEVTISGFDSSVEGEQTLTYSISASKTNETLSWESSIIVYGITHISLDTTNVVKNFNVEGDFNYSGLVVTAHYGSNDEAGTVVLTSDRYSVEPQDWTVGENKAVLVTVNDTGVSETYYININGIIALNVNIENCALYDAEYEGFRVYKNRPLVTSGKTATVTKYQNGAKVSEVWSGNIETEAIDTSTTGEKTVKFSIVDGDYTISDEKKVMVYESLGLEIQNPPTIFYVRNGIEPAFSLGDMEVYQNDSDSRKTKLTLNALTNGFSVIPEVGSLLSIGTVRIKITSTNRDIEIFTVEVIDNYPKADATISVEGSLVRTLYNIGETVDLSGLTVKVSEMANGDQNSQVPFTAIISGQNTLTFDDDFEGGYYDLEISVEGIETPYIIENAVQLDGVDEITNLTSTKVYRSGENFDKNEVSGTIVYLGGSTRAIQPNDIVCETTTLHYGDNSISMTIAGKSVSLSVEVRKVTALSIALKTGKTNNYNHGDAFNRYNYTYTAIYGGDDYTLEIPASELVFTGATENDLEATTSSPVVNVTLTYTEDTYSVSETIALNVKRIKSVSFLNGQSQPVEKITFDYGDEIDLTDYAFSVLFNDDTSNYVLDNNIELIKAGHNLVGTNIVNKIENATISATCGKETVSTTITLHIHYLSAISVDFSGIGSVYAFDTLNLASVTATKTLASTDSDDVLYPQTSDCTSDLSFTFGGQNIGINNFKLPTAGTYQLRASITSGLQTLSQTTNLVVNAVTLESISITKSAAFKPLANYVEDEYLNLEGMSVNLVYNKTASNRSISYTNPAVKVVDSNGDSFSKIKQLKSTDNNKEIFIKYEENGITKTASIGIIHITEKALTSIEITQAPTKTSFTYGDIFSIDGAVVKANFNNGTNEIIALSSLSVSGVNIGHKFLPSSDNLANSITITFAYTYNGATRNATYTIELAAPVIKELRTNANEATTSLRLNYKDGDTYSEAGLVVTAVMENGWEVVLESQYFLTNATTVLGIEGGEINVNGSYGYKTITVSGTNPYDNTDIKSVTYDVEIVSSGAVVSATLKLEGDYNKYIIGDTFSGKGISFIVTDVDGKTWESTNFNIEPSLGITFRSAQRIEAKVTYSNGSYTKTESFSIIVSVPNSTDVVDTNNYQLAIGRANGTLFESITHEEATIKFGKVYDSNGYLIGEFYPLFHEDKISIDTNALHTNTLGFNIYTGSDETNDCIGYIDLGNGEVRNAHIVLFEDPINPIEGDSNIEVLFPHYVEGNADKINKCRFGTIFNNRLFVSGNTDMPNIDFHTSETNNEKNEFTYFSDLDYCKYGSDHSAVVGYGIYRDGDLLIFKKGSRTEATVYKREIKLSQATDYAGNTLDESLGEETYPCFPVNSFGGVGALSNRSIVNFFGETLVLTVEGLKAITSKENVYGNSKYSFDVSSNINPRLIKENLEYAFLFAHEDKVYLRTNNGIYVGYQEIRDENGEYEWYFLSDISADIFFELDKQLYFANNNGGIYRVVSNLFTDKNRIFVGVGGTTLSIDEANNKVIVSGDYEANIKEGNSFHVITDLDVLTELPTTQIHASIGLFINENTRTNNLVNPLFNQTLYDGIIDPNNDTIEIKPYKSDSTLDKSKRDTVRLRFYEGLPIYLDQIVGHGLKVAPNTLYYLKSYQSDTDKYQLENENGEIMDLAGVETFRISFSIGENKLTTIHNVGNYLDTNGKQFELLGSHNQVLNLIYYNDKNDCNYKGVITMPKPVEAYYVTPPYVLGSALNMKTVWSVSSINDTGLASAMEVGYLSSHKQSDYGTTINTASGSLQIDFNNFAFDKIQFINDGLPHIYQKYKVIPRVGFIRFMFRNNEDSNLIISSLSIVYTHSQFTKGEM